MKTLIEKSDKKRLLEIFLLFFIILSTTTVALETVEFVAQKYNQTIYWIELLCTIVFTIEYFLRIFLAEKKTKYIFSFYGIIDLISISPLILALVQYDATSILVIRSIRLLRVFRLFKLAKYIGAEEHLRHALRDSAKKITVFLLFISVLLTILGSLMYLIEGSGSGFTSIPKSIYWAIVTMTTVGYGDIAPITILGQCLSSVIMLLGYGIIAVPTGIVIKSMSNQNKPCPHCSYLKNPKTNRFCGQCGKELFL